MTIRLITILLVITAIGTLAWRFSGDGEPGAPANARPADGPGAGPAATAAHAVVTWQGMQLEVPAGWQQLDAGNDHATWGAPDRAHTVTLGSTPASSLPLADVVDGARAELQSLPEVRGMRMSEQRGGTQVTLAFTAGAKGTSMRVQQVWRRDVGRSVDMIATWSSAEGAGAPPRPQAPAPA